MAQVKVRMGKGDAAREFLIGESAITTKDGKTYIEGEEVKVLTEKAKAKSATDEAVTDAQPKAEKQAKEEK